jgi:hypothetical protein
MTDDARCTWCSAELPNPAAATCPTCGATLVGDGEAQLPGVTALDAEAIARTARTPLSRPRSRLLAWISGEPDDDDSAPAPPGSLAPPPPDVRAEMLRLEIAAEFADLEAEAGSIVAEAEIEALASGRPSGTEPAPAVVSEPPNGEREASAEPAGEVEAAHPESSEHPTTA